MFPYIYRTHTPNLPLEVRLSTLGDAFVLSLRSYARATLYPSALIGNAFVVLI